MNEDIRKLQLRVLEAFSRIAVTFSLAGGTALELFYLKHRFSKDLDFFSSKYRLEEIEQIISGLKNELKLKVKFENEFIAEGRAKVRFYTVRSKETKSGLKIDFIEDVLLKKPKIRYFGAVPVYDVKNIYTQKIFAVAGTRIITDSFGKERATGRNEARDVFDIYMLSKQIEPLHKHIKHSPRAQQRGLVQWWRSFSRLDLKIGLMDLEIYQKIFDVSEMLSHLDYEIMKYIEEEIDI